MPRFILSFLFCLSALSGSVLRLDVEGVWRTAEVYLPSKTEGAPLVLVFHGHGGSSRNAKRDFHLETLWPEAIVVYPQGLPTKGQLTDPEGRRSGWQAAMGTEGDRDLLFYDALLRHFAKLGHGSIFVTGHSNGGGFCYLLQAARASSLRGLAPSSAVTVRDLQALSPLPVLHLGGTDDDLVKWSWQKRMIEYLLRLNACEQKGRRLDDWTTVYESVQGTPVYTFVHSGGHRFPSEAPAAIVRFFKNLNAQAP